MMSLRFALSIFVVCSACGRGGFEPGVRSLDGVEPDGAATSQNDPQVNVDSDLVGGCSPGFELTDEGCSDVDECVLNTPCSDNQGCVNLPGGFRCECLPGFIDAGDACVDADDCVDAVCDVNAVCIDEVGSFSCECSPPLVGDGSSCTTCGNGTCEGSEGCESCPNDCGVCSSECTGGVCTVTGLRLLEASTGADRGVLSDGQEIELSSFPAGFGLVADVEPATVGSVGIVVVGLDDRNDDEAPFTFRNASLDSEGQIVQIDTFPALPGTYHLEFTPYGAPGATGQSGEPFLRSVTIRGEFEVPINRAAGDAVETLSTTGFRDDEDTIDLGHGFSAFRFSGQNYSREVDYDVFLQVTAAEDSNAESCTVVIRLVRDQNNVTQRFSEFPTASGSVSWDLPPFTAGTNYRSGNLASLLAEVLPTRGNGFLNLLVVTERVENSQCSREAFAQDSNKSLSAKLVVSR